MCEELSYIYIYIYVLHGTLYDNDTCIQVYDLCDQQRRLIRMSYQPEKNIQKQ